MFEQGDLKYVILKLLAEKPRHGYEIIKELEAQSGGVYAPSAGAIYPTLTLLEDMGYAESTAEAGGKKVYSITEAGKAHLAENQATVEDVFERIADIGSTVFSDTMKEVGRAFGHIARAAFSAPSSHLRDKETSHKILEILRRASHEIDDVLGEARKRGTTPPPAQP